MSPISTSCLAICVLALTWAPSTQQLVARPPDSFIASCNYQLDVIFAVDLSNSIPDFNVIKNAMLNLVQSLRISPKDIHVGLVPFSTSINQFPLSGDKNTILASINRFVFLDGSTRTHSAINVATKLFADGARGGNVKKLLIVITDGRSDEPSLTLAAANNAKRAGISIFTVGVSSRVIEQELQLVASSRNQVFRIEKFQDLAKDLVKATNKACTSIVTPQPPTVAPPACNDIMDFVIVIDGSRNVNEFEFEVQKEAVANLVENLRVSPNAINVALVVFSGSVMSYPLNGNQQQVVSAIHSLKHFGHESRTDLAINEALNLFRRGRTGNVKRLLMVITDGRAADSTLAIQAAQSVKSSGVSVYSVGVSNKIDRGELQALASVPSQVTYTSVQGLQNDLLLATTQACSYVPATVVLPPADPMQCFQQLDFVIAMDSSNSISPENFRLEKAAIIDLIRNLRVTPQDINVGFVEFSTQVTAFPLSGDKQGIINYITSAKFMDDTTNTNGAIDAATGLFFNARGGNVKKVLLVVTDGRASQRNKALQSAQNAKAQGISIYVVGVTNQVDQNELLALASAPSQVFYSNNFQGLRNELNRAATQACSSVLTGPPPVPTQPAPTVSSECLQPLDFIIAVDASNSINVTNFELQRHAMSNLVTNLQISPSIRRVGLVLFSTTTQTYPMSGNPDQVLYNINQMKYLNDLTYTYRAINDAYQMFMTNQRQNVRRILIIVTDGRANDPTKTQLAAQRVKDAGITIYSVGVTNNVDRQELANLASSSSQVMMSNNFQNLQNDLIRAVSQACNYKPPTIPTVPTAPPTLPPECFQQLDFVIVIDSSDSIQVDDFTRQKQAISNLVQSLQISPNDIKMGLVLFSKSATSYQLSGNRQQILNEINNFQHLDSSTMTHLAINSAYNMFQNQGRNGVRRILIIITDGQSTDHEAALVSASRVKNAGISIYAVGVGYYYDLEELENLASSSSQVLYTNSYEALKNDLIRAASEACRYAPAPRPPTVPPAIPTLPPTLPPQCFDQLDFVMAIDSSNSLGQRRFQTQRQAISNLVSGLGVSPNGINVGMVLFSSTVKDYPLSGSRQQLLYDIDHLEYLDGSTRTDLAIYKAIEVFQRARNGNVRKILMIVTDGKASNSDSALAAAQQAKNSGITIYAVGVTNEVNMNELRTMASSPNMAFHINNFQSLQNALIRATTQACVTRPYIDSGLTGRLCEHSGHRNGGIGHANHPTDCNGYIQCYFNLDTGQEIAVVRHCPFGLFWDGVKIKCVPSSSIHCAYDRCREDGVKSYPMAGTVRAYWKCEETGRTTGHCCPESYDYLNNHGCEWNSNTREACDVADKGEFVACDKKPSWKKPDSYEVLRFRNFGSWSIRPCLSNNFDIADCKCSAPRTDSCQPDYTNVFRDIPWNSNIVNHGTQRSGQGAVMDGHSWIRFSQYSKIITVPVTFTISYRQGSPARKDAQVLVTSNHECSSQAGQLLITASKVSVQAQIISLDGRIAMITLPLGYKWSQDLKQLTFSYDQSVMAIKVTIGQTTILQEVKAPSGVFFPCGFTIGRGQAIIPGFTGTIQDLAVYSCSPSKMY